MRFANYGRKSVYSDKSDSVNNQFRMCKEYAESLFMNEIESFETYADEGFTGANTDRPELKRLMQDIEDGLVDVLIVYQLDRLSRNVRDFSNIYETLEEHNVKLISLKESIDTSTPMGRAMINITMVFAQMERETIANRVTDNLLGLVKKGFWAGSKPPVGYKRMKIERSDKKHCTLIKDEETAPFVEKIYDDYLTSDGGLFKLQNKYKKEGLKNPTGSFISSACIHRIVSSPCYCAATQSVYEYWKEQGSQVFSPKEEWDGTHGVMVYGRRPKKRNCTLTPKTEWIVCVGLHPPIINADKWLAAQSKFKHNTTFKSTSNDVPLLKGIVRCAKCGRKMSFQLDRRMKHLGYYRCDKKKAMGKEFCDLSSIRNDVLDEQVFDLFKKIKMDKSLIYQYMEDEKPKIKQVKDRTREYETKIHKLTTALLEAKDSPATKYIVKQIEQLDSELQAHRKELSEIKKEERKAAVTQSTKEKKIENFFELVKDIETLPNKEQNKIARSVISDCTWDGQTLFIKL